MKPSLFILIFLTIFGGASAQKNEPSTESIQTQKHTSDSTLYASNSSYIAKKTAMKSAMIPGWGQYTNKQYIKIPIIYAVLGVLGYFVYDNYRGYKEATQAYLYRIDLNPETESERYKNSSQGFIISSRKQYRENLDYSVLGIVGIYALNILDAAVFAHLLKFDISNSVSFTPGLQLPITHSSPQAKVGLTVSF